MSNPKLVVIEKNNVYSFYIGQNKIVSVQSDEPISREQLEEYRKDPISLKMKIMQLIGDEE